MTPRTLRNWKKLDPAEEVPPPGRPRTGAAVLEEAKDLVRGELERQGWAAGEEPVWRALGGRVPRARVRRVLAALKAEHRARCRSRAAEVRVSARVHAPDALWSMDATHLGRDAHRHAIQAEVIRDVASTRTIGIAVGKAAEAEDVVALLERTAAERGCAPLVLVTDNGAPYRSDAVASWCARHGVLQLVADVLAGIEQ